jgi:hypothetical protein
MNAVPAVERRINQALEVHRSKDYEAVSRLLSQAPVNRVLVEPIMLPSEGKPGPGGPKAPHARENCTGSKHTDTGRCSTDSVRQLRARTEPAGLGTHFRAYFARP